ncbi:MAG: hypothetical protein ACJAZO_004020 [Myxococcota bacterium]|jgi:hypothetical protein
MLKTMKKQLTAGTIKGEDHALRPRRKRFAGAIFLVILMTGTAVVLGVIGAASVF